MNAPVAAQNINGPNRYVCSALEDARKVLERHEVSLMTTLKDTLDQDSTLRPIYVLRSLVEEIQVYVNRMEAALYDQQSYERLKNDYKELKEEVEKLKKEKNELTKD